MGKGRATHLTNGEQMMTLGRQDAVITFGIPLVSKLVARDWASVERLLSTTLGSIFNQADVPVRVVIACHEPPDIPEVADERVTIRRADFDIPRFRWEMEIDRMRKLEVLGAELRTRGGGWMFISDADDFVARNLAKTILASDAKAVIVRRGYQLDALNSRYQPLSKLWGKCGSCAAVNWTVDELPEKPLSDNPPIFHEYCDTRHFSLHQFFQAQGWRWMFLADPLVTYVVNHGSNQSRVTAKTSLKWKIYFMLQQWKPWTEALDVEFGVTQVQRAKAIYSGSNPFSTELGVD